MANPLSKLWKRWFGSAPVAPPASTPASAPLQRPPQPVAATPQANAASADAPAASAAVAAEPATPPLVAWKPQLPVNAMFFDWLMGSPGSGDNHDTEQAALQALYGLLASDLNDAVVVPRVPSVIPQLLASLRSKSVSTGELARQIVKDVALVGEVINTVNSALYNPADRINSLDKAVMMLGEEGLRLVIAKVAFRPIINLSAGQYTRRAAPLIWAQAEKCAVACHYLAREIDPFHAFLTGLMKNVGLIIAFRLLDQQSEHGKFKYSASFHASVTAVAATLSYRIAQRWDFPPHVVQALQQQSGGSKAIDWSPLGHLLHCADLLSKMRLLANHGQLRTSDKSLKFGLSPEAGLCFDNLNTLQVFELHSLPDEGEPDQRVLG